MDRSSVVKPDPRRGLPSVGRLIEEIRAELPDLPDWALLAGARAAIERARSGIADQSASEPAGSATGASAGAEAILTHALAEALRAAAPYPRRVINATGIVLHTNMGRSPLASGATAAALEASGYCDLELDLRDGRRGQRAQSVSAKLCELSGAAAAYVCNNNAAAVLLALDSLARGREVIVSRGELVEIGGAFRVPDIMERSGVRLVEVGTTNRTHARDYEAAVTPRTALLLKVHRSNFSQTGFVAEVGLGELAKIGQRHGIAVVDDLGSGTLVDLRSRGLPEDSFAPSRLAQGADLVCFSGDKLLGGPQAGIVLGSAAAIDAMRQNPLARALRLDKMSLAALDWTLASMLGGRAEDEVPALRALLAEPSELEGRARLLAAELGSQAGIVAAVESGESPVGGGSLPGHAFATWVVTVQSRLPAQKLTARLREASPPVVARVRDGVVVLDLRTIEAADAEEIVRAFCFALN